MKRGLHTLQLSRKDLVGLKIRSNDTIVSKNEYDCKHQMGREYEYNLTLIRIDKEKKEYDYEKNK